MHPRMLLPALAIAALGATGALAGPLTPPDGPVVPTHKTLTDVEPRTPMSGATTPGTESSVFVVSQPGDYYLTADVAVPAGKNGITVTAPDVTIDLSGFTIRGETGSLAGIAVIEADRLAVRNGRIRTCGGDGVSALASPEARFENLMISDCGGSGLVTGNGAAVDLCTAESCGAEGFLLEVHSVLRDCIAAGNGGIGIRMQGRSQAVRCTVRDNQGPGVQSDGHANIVRECTIMDNVGDGIAVLGTGAVVSGNYCVGHAPPGGGVTVYSAATDNAIIGNLIIGPPTVGYAVHVVSTGNLVARNWGASSGYNIFSGNARGPLIGAATMLTNSNPDANYVY